MECHCTLFIECLAFDFNFQICLQCNVLFKQRKCSFFTRLKICIFAFWEINSIMISLRSKASGSDRISAEQFKILKDVAVKVLHSISQ